jgi:N-acyl-D-aspartate/D-glutamate deacylase
VIRNARAVDETVAAPRPAVNFASLVGHGWVREAVMRRVDRGCAAFQAPGSPAAW